MYRQSIPLRGTSLLLVIMLSGTVSHAQSDQNQALKYHAVLVKRPDAGYLFDRFYNSWLDHGTVEELGQFLEQRVVQDKQAADQLLLAFFHAKQGDEVRALELLSAASAAEPGNALVWFLKADAEARTLDFDAAIADLERAKTANPEEKLATDIARLLGKLYVRNRQTDKALQVWRQLLTEHADDEDLHEDIIELQVSEGLYDEATAQLEQLIAQTTDKYKQVLRRIRSGDILQRAGKRSEATEVYAATLERVGHGTWLEREILSLIEELFRREDDLAGLQQQYEKLLEAYPRRVQIHLQFASLLTEIGDNETAQQQMASVLELTPGDRANTEAYVALLASTGNVAGAVRAMKSLIAQHPEDGELQLRLASLHNSAGNKAAAAGAIQQYVRGSDQSEYVFLRAARMLCQFEAYEEADGVYQRLIDAHPESMAGREAQAAFLYDRHRKDEALNIWRSLADHKDRATVVHVARILASRNEHQPAFDLLQARSGEFTDDAVYLGQLVSSAMALEKFEEAVPWVRRRVQLASLSSDLDSAVTEAALVTAKAGQTLTVIKELLSAPSRSVQDTCLLAELLERSGDVARAQRVLHEAAPHASALALNQLVRLHTQRREWREATEAIKTLLATPGERKTLHVQRLVEIYQRDDQLNEALHWVQEWKKSSPGNVTPWLKEARLLTLQDRTDEAIEILRHASQQFEGDAEVWAKLAALYEEAGKLADAERIYWRLYEDGKDLNAKLRWVQRLATVAELEGTTDKLVARFEERQRGNRRSVEPWLALAEIHRIGYDYEQRHKALMEATRLRPDDLQLLQQVARIEETEGDLQKALATLERAAELDSSTRTKEQIARLHLNSGDLDRGYAMLDELANGKTADARSVESMAMAMAGVRDWERLIEFLGRKILEHPDDYRLRYLLAVAHEEAGGVASAQREFLALISPQKDIPGLPAGQVPQPPWGPFMGSVVSLLPAESQEIMQLGWLHEVVYSHRERGGGYYSMSFSQPSVGPSAVAMPPSAENVREYCLSHLQTMGQELDEDGRSELIAQMQAHGISNAEVLLEIPPSVDGFDESAVEIAVKYPDNKGLLALAVLSGGDASAPSNVEVAERAYHAFQEERPQLAFMAAILIARTDETRTALLDEAIANISRIEAPNLFLVIYIASALGGDWGMSEGPTLPEKYHEILTKQLLAWYPKMPSLGPPGLMVFYFVANALSASEDPTAFLALLDDEVTRWRAQTRPAPLAAMYGLFGSGNDGQLIEPLTFPPTSLADFPPHVLSQLVGDEDPFGTRFMESVDPLVIKKHLTTIQDPTLRVLLALHLRQEPIIEETLNTMLQADPPSLDAFLLAAAKETADLNYVAAAELLDKARYLPMTRELRQRIDGALVALATETDAGPAGSSARQSSVLASGFRKAISALAAVAGEPQSAQPKSTSVAELGRAAALRLRRMPLQMEQRAELVSAMDQLGLEEEAERLEESQANQPPLYAAGGSSYYSSSTQTSPIVKMLGEGKREQAVRLIVREFSNISRNASAGETFTPSQHIDLRQVIYAYGLADQVLAELDPGESDNLLKLTSFGFLCETLNLEDRALEIYRKILSKPARNDAVRLRVLLLTLKNDVDAAVTLMRGFESRYVADMGMALSSEYGREDTDAVPRLSIVEAVCSYLHQLEEDDAMDLSWVENLAAQLSAEQSFGRAELNDLYEKPAEDKESSNEAKELERTRRDAHNRLCRAMLEHSALASDGFRRLLAAAKRFDEPLDPFVSLAVETLVRTEKIDGDPNAVTAYHMRRYSSGWDDSDMWYPEEFLVRYAWSTKDARLIPEIVVPAIREADRPARAAQIELLDALFVCDEADYLEKATAYVNGCRPPGRAYANGAFDGPSLSMVVKVWKDRTLRADLQPLIVDKIRETIRRDPSSGLDEVTYPTSFALALVENGQGDRVPDFLEAVADICLGPHDKRAALIERYYDPQRYSSGGAAATRVMAFVSLAQGLLQRPELTFAVLDFLKENSLQQAVEDLDYVLYEIFAASDEEMPDRVMAFLESSPFLNDLSTLDVVDVPNSTGSSLLGRFLIILHGNSDEVRKNVCGRLQARDPRTFGSQLIVACLGTSQPAPPTGFVELLVAHDTAVRALPLEKARSIARLFRELEKADDSVKPPQSEDVASMLAWLNELIIQDKIAIVENVLAAEKLEEILDDSDDLTEAIGDILPYLIKTDRVRAERFFRKCSQLLSETTDDYYYDVSDLLDFPMSSDVDFDTVAFLLDRFLEAENTNPRNVYQHYRWAVPVIRTFEEALAENDTTAALEKTYGELQSHFGARPTTILASHYCDLFVSLGPDDLHAVVGWTQKKVAREPESGIARELAAAAGWAEHRNQLLDITPPPNRMRPETLESFHEYYLSVIRNERLPIHYRLSVVGSLFSRDDSTLPVPLVFACAELLRDALQSDKIELGESEWEVMQALQAMEPTPAWQTTVGSLMEIWNRRYLAGAGEIASGSTDSALKLNLLLGNGQDVQRMLRRASDVLHDPTCIALLAQQGQHAAAAKLFRAGWSTMDLEENLALVHFDALLEQQLPKFLAAIQPDDLRYLAEVVMATLPDTEHEDQSPSVGHSERIRQLAEQLNGRESMRPVIRQSALIALSLHAEAAQIIEPHLAELIRDIPLDGLARMEEYELKHRFQSLLESYVRACIESGHVQPVMRLLDEADNFDASRRSGYHYYDNDTRALLVSSLAHQIAERLAEWPQDRVAEVLPLLRRLTTPAQSNQDSDLTTVYEFMEVNLVAHAMSDRMEEYEKWWHGLSDEMKSDVRKSGGTWNTALAATCVGERTAENVDLRIRVYKAVLKTADMQEWPEWTDPFFDAIDSGDGAYAFAARTEKAGLLSVRELLTHGPEIADSTAAGGLSWAALAGAQTQARRLEAAVESWHKAIEALPTANKVRATKWRMNLALALHRLARNAEAIDTLKSLAPETVDEALKPAYDALLRTLTSNS